MERWGGAGGRATFTYKSLKLDIRRWRIHGLFNTAVNTLYDKHTASKDGGICESYIALDGERTGHGLICVIVLRCAPRILPWEEMVADRGVIYNLYLILKIML